MKKTALILSLALAAVTAVSCGSAPVSSPADSGSASQAEAKTEAQAEAVTEAEKEENKELDISALSSFELTSADLTDGVWNTEITNTQYGQNRSPQLSWKPVEGAANYVIYMIDTTAGNWVHWRSVSEGETELAAGWASEKEYVGPYPPEGTHDYEIYVFALKEPAKKVRGALDSASPRFFELLTSLDNDGGNILACGHLTGTYTHGDK